MSGRGPVIGDFGIAYGQDHNQIDDDSHAFVGTPNYMSPEQIREIGARLARGRIHALGCLTIQFCAGVLHSP